MFSPLFLIVHTAAAGVAAKDLRHEGAVHAAGGDFSLGGGVLWCLGSIIHAHAEDHCFSRYHLQWAAHPSCYGKPPAATFRGVVGLQRSDPSSAAGPPG